MMSRSLPTQNVVLFDGDAPVPIPVIGMELKDAYLNIELPDGKRVQWPTKYIRRIADAPSHGDVLYHISDPLVRVFVPDDSIGRHLPHLDIAAPPKGRGRLAVWAAAAVAAVFVQVFVLIPLLANQLAGFIPEEGERALGEATLGQIQSVLAGQGDSPLAFCEEPAGQDALASMTARLVDPLEAAPLLDVRVLDHPMVNAFALPGGYVVLFRGLIEAAEGPDEVAAVLAHEIGHVAARHPTRHALRSAGSLGVIGLLFGDFAGGYLVTVIVDRLINAQYSQTAETEADAFAVELMQNANANPDALAVFFERLQKDHGTDTGIFEHFQSHPGLEDRVQSVRDKANTPNDTSPILAIDAWTALRKICG